MAVFRGARRSEAVLGAGTLVFRTPRLLASVAAINMLQPFDGFESRGQFPAGFLGDRHENAVLSSNCSAFLR